MSYCENCGAELEANSKFCNECGSKQEVTVDPNVDSNDTGITKADREEVEGNTIPIDGNLISGQKITRINPKIIVASILGCVVLLIAGIAVLIAITQHNGDDNSDITVETVAIEENVDEVEEEIITEDTSEEVIVEDTSILATIDWEFNSEKLQELKELSIIGYSPITINQGFANYNVSSWQYGGVDNIEYILIEFEDEAMNYQMIINCTLLQVEEMYKDEFIMDDEECEEWVDSIFNIELPFVGKSGSYSTIGATLNIVVEGDVVTSTILIDNYEEPLVGKVISSSEAEVYLESGETICYTWLDEETVVVNPANGFSQETINMIRQVCEALNGTVYTYASNTLSDSENANFVATYLPTIGTYYNSGDGGLADTYEIVIHSTNNNSFIFTITEVIDSNREMVINVIIENGVAVFNESEDQYAYYIDDTYDIRFDCAYPEYIGIAGYEPMTRITSEYFLNIWY